jgi:MFS transporter, PAT family, beta-lactamase induction signal transducer AmpG
MTTRSTMTAQQALNHEILNKDNKSLWQLTLDWCLSFKIYLQPQIARMLALGFSAGLPMLLVFGTLSAWLREAGINRSTIGFLSWIGLLYAFKWVWSPLVDRMRLPVLTQQFGQRRSWMLLSQAGVMLGLISMALTDPKYHLMVMVFGALWVAFFSATQDIALDALRIESADDSVQAALSAAYQTGYRFAMIWAGAGTLWLASWWQGDLSGYVNSAWTLAYSVMALSMLVGVLAVWFTQEPSPQVTDQPASTQPVYTPITQRLWNAIAMPLLQFSNRFGWQQATIILMLVSIYRISDIVMGVMANSFYIDMGFSKTEIANVTKIYGVIMTLVGAAVGGVLCLRLGVMRMMMVGAILSALTNVSFSWLATISATETAVFKYWALAGVISADNFATGIATAAFIAYMSSLTSRGYSATQYALFSSLMILLPKLLAGFSGRAVDAVGYANFFIGTALLGIPVLVLVALASRQVKLNINV